MVKKEIVTIVDFTVTSMATEDSIVKSTVKTCVCAGIYDLKKDAVIRNALNLLMADVKQKEAKSGKRKSESGNQSS